MSKDSMESPERAQQPGEMEKVIERIYEASPQLRIGQIRPRGGEKLSGWIKLHRQITESDVYQMPPLYLRVFERLIIEANHQDNEIPYKKHSQDIACKKLIKRGERLTSIRQICQWVGWYERGIFKMPNPKTIKTILDWLQQNDMIQIYNNEGNRKETHYRIVNYDIYQSDDNTKVTEKKQSGNSKETEKKQSLDTNKNDKNDKNDKKILSISADLSKNLCDKFHSIPNVSINTIDDMNFFDYLLDKYEYTDINYILDNLQKKMSKEKVDDPKRYIEVALENNSQQKKPISGQEIQNTTEPPDEETFKKWLEALPK